MKPSHTANRNVNWYSHFGKGCSSSPESAYDPLITLLGICPREIKIYVHTDICKQDVQSGIHNIQKSLNYPDVHQLMSRQAKCTLSLLQGIFPTQGLNPGLPHCRQILYQLSHKRSPRILQWVACPFSSRSF